jgi:predicted ATPase
VRKASNNSRCIVGREAERDVLSQAYDRAQQGRGGVVCISGDVGLGKSSLIDVFVEDLLHDGQTFHLARSRCSESLTESEPFMPWIEGLSALAEEPTISDLIQKAAPQWYREISHSGARAPARMNRELLDLFKQVSAVHPLIVVIDDFHWADIGSVDLLAFLASRLESTRVLIVVCYRPVEMKLKRHSFLRVRLDILSRGQCIEICLHPLSRKHVEQFVALSHSHAKFSPEHQALLHAKSEGNPLFLREFISDHTQVGDSVRNIIKGKLERLDDTHRQLLVTASVQGREFDSAVVSSTMQMQSQDVEEALQELDEVHGLIHRIREEELPDGKFTVRYRFAYTLYQEACYQSLAPTRKASLSASLAEAFLTFYGN